jgi:hypothetical protein
MTQNKLFLLKLEENRRVDNRKFIWFFRDKVSVKILAAFDEKQKTVLLSRICCYDRGNGYASEALRIITRLADKMGVIIRLYPLPFYLTLKEDKGLLTKQQLIAWYKKNGFRWKCTGGVKDFMERIPLEVERETRPV